MEKAVAKAIAARRLYMFSEKNGWNPLMRLRHRIEPTRLKANVRSMLRVVQRQTGKDMGVK